MFSLDCYLPPEDVSKETYIGCRTFMTRASSVAFCLVLVIVAIIFTYFWHPAFAIIIPFVLALMVWRWWSAPIGHGPHWDNVDAVIKDIMATEGKDRAAAIVKYRADAAARHASIMFAHGVGSGVGKIWGPPNVRPPPSRGAGFTISPNLFQRK
jgi:hypothetical protein